jgi:uncharacterized tellurite resistance protein B-like protein
MHILLLVLAVLGAVIFWIHRLRGAGTLAHAALDTAQRVRGFSRRKRFCSQAEGSPLTAVDDPAAAAAAMMVSLAASRGTLSAVSEDRIKDEIRHSMGLAHGDEIYAFGRWISDQVLDPNSLSLRFARLWLDALQPMERREFYEMCLRVILADGEPTSLQAGAAMRLKERLGLLHA